MNRKKIIYILIIIFLLIAVFIIYSLFNGNPISQINAKKTLEQYLVETYPDEEFYISKDRFDPEFMEYWFTVIKQDVPTAQQYTFTVPTRLSEYELSDGIFFDTLDVELNAKFEKEARDIINERSAGEIPEIRELEVDIYVLKDKYEPNQTWDTHIEMDKPMFIQMTIDGSDLSKRDILDVAKKVQTILNDEGYDYSKVALNVYVPFKNEWLDEWIVKYMIEFDQTNPIVEDDIEEHNSEFLTHH